MWTPSDIAWVPAERRPAAPLVLTDAEATCSSRRSAAALAATTEVVDLCGADGAHPVESPEPPVCITYAANWRRHPPPASRSPRPSGCGMFEPSHNRNRNRVVNGSVLMGGCQDGFVFAGRPRRG